MIPLTEVLLTEKERKALCHGSPAFSVEISSAGERLLDYHSICPLRLHLAACLVPTSAAEELSQ